MSKEYTPAIKPFAESCRERGMREQVLFRASQVADVLGIDIHIVRDEMRAGRLKSILPVGRQRGRLSRAEWVDEWLEEGTHGVR